MGIAKCFIGCGGKYRRIIACLLRIFNLLRSSAGFEFKELWKLRKIRIVDPI
jgi:hypothetical protein